MNDGSTDYVVSKGHWIVEMNGKARLTRYDFEIQVSFISHYITLHK